jgi:peptidyl-prolyl cis-trans isomerase D
MFDLFRSRAKAMRYLLMALLSLVALSMVVTLIPGFGVGFGTGNQQVLAQVGDELITAKLINRLIQMQMKQQQFPRDMAEMIIPQMVNQYVGEMATVYQAQRLGFTVSEQELIDGIRKMIPQLIQSGQFVGKEAYESYLAQMNTTIEEFESNVRKQILLSKLQGLVLEGVVVTPQEIQAEFQKRGEKVKLEVVKFDSKDFRSQALATRKEIEDYYAANKESYKRPEQRSFQILMVTEDKLGESIPLTDAVIRQAYDSNRDRYKVDERAKVRHILIKADPDLPKAEKDKLKAKAADILKQVRGGANFAELAKKHSEDPGSGSKGGDLGWIQRGQTVADFEKTAFSQKPNQISDLVETMFGYHIIQTLEIQGAHVRPFEEVKEELAKELKRRQLFEKMPDLADQAKAELTKNPGQARQIAERLNLAFINAENLISGAPIPTIGTSMEIHNAVGALNKGGVTDVIQLPENRLAVAVLTDIIPPQQAPLPEVENEIGRVITDRKSSELADKKAREFETRLKANKNDLRKTAQEMGLKVIETDPFERTGQIKDVGPAAYFGEQPFIQPVGAVVGLYRVASIPYFYKIVSRTPPDPADLSKQRDVIVTALRDKKLRERREMFEQGLVRKLTEEGKIKINDDAIKRLAASYKG